MKITKLGHCCLVVEYKGKRILTDPGAWSTAQNEIKDIDIILITHEHSDHLHIESLQIVLQNNPSAKIITNTAVGKILSEKSIAFEILEQGQSKSYVGILIEVFGDKHEEIYEQFGLVQNTGYFIDNILFYPGDAFTNPGKSVKVLAIPVSAVWTTLKSAIDYGLKVKPEVAFPVHDGALVEGRMRITYKLPEQIFEKNSIKFLEIKEGESFEA